MSPLKLLDALRFNFEGELTRTEIKQLPANPAVKVVLSEVRYGIRVRGYNLQLGTNSGVRSSYRGRRLGPLYD
jgi:hypothetical protein